MRAALIGAVPALPAVSTLDTQHPRFPLFDAVAAFLRRVAEGTDTVHGGVWTIHTAAGGERARALSPTRSAGTRASTGADAAADHA